MIATAEAPAAVPAAPLVPPVLDVPGAPALVTVVFIPVVPAAPVVAGLAAPLPDAFPEGGAVTSSVPVPWSVAQAVTIARHATNGTTFQLFKLIEKSLKMFCSWAQEAPT
jgi:hypothetical protein